MVYTLPRLRYGYQESWDHMVVNPEREHAIKAAAEKIISHKPIYVGLQDKTGVPWYFIGILHYRESDCNFHTHLHNGDSLARRTVQVPAGRPRVADPGEPPFTFTHSSIDALQYEGFLKQDDWSIPAMAYRFEQYNGWGYRMHGCPSAYVWSGSNQYSRGKYVADHVFDSSVNDPQMGTMPILKEIATIENLTFPTAPQPAATPVIPSPDKTDTPNVVLSPKADLPTPSSKEMRQTSRKYWWHDVLHNIAVFFGFGGVATQGLMSANLESTKPAMDSVKTFIGDYGMWALIGICGGLIVFTVVQKMFMKQDVQEGRAITSGTDPNKVV